LRPENVKNDVKRRLKQGSSFLFIALGILMVLNILCIGNLLATLVYADVFYQLVPGGTAATPDQLTAGQTISLQAHLVFQDTATGFSVGAMAYESPAGSAQVKIYEDGTLILTPSLSFSTTGAQTYQDGTKYIAVYRATWTVPNTEGKTYRFLWEISNTAAGSASTETYGKTPVNEPDGTFYVNNVAATATTTHSLISPTVNLKFVPSAQADRITSITVERCKGGTIQETVTLTKQAEGSYAGTVTLPSYGTYRLDGYINWSGGNIPKMSIMATYGSGDGGNGGFELNQIVGLAFIMVGVAIMLHTRKH